MSVAVCTKLAQIAKDNAFRLKDEDYFKDSDEELQREKLSVEQGPGPGAEAEFNPLGHFKLDQLEDIEAQIALKREENDQLEQWRRRRLRARADALEQFKEEQAAYRRIKRAPEQADTAAVDVAATTKVAEPDGRALSERERALQRGLQPDGTAGGGDGDGDFEFDPFAMLLPPPPPPPQSGDVVAEEPLDAAGHSGGATGSRGKAEHEEFGPYDPFDQYDVEQIEEFEGDEAEFNMMDDPF